MKLRILSQLALTILMGMSISCNDDDPPMLDLPDATEEGLNTFGFLLDGEVWTNFGESCSDFGCSVNEVTATLIGFEDDQFRVQVTASHTHDGIIQSSTLVFNYFLQDDLVVAPGISFVETGKSSIKTYTDGYESDFELELSRFDLSSRVASGTFSGVLKSIDDQSNAFVITEGRFDVSLPQ